MNSSWLQPLFALSQTFGPFAGSTRQAPFPAPVCLIRSVFPSCLSTTSSPATSAAARVFMHQRISPPARIPRTASFST